MSFGREKRLLLGPGAARAGAAALQRRLSWGRAGRLPAGGRPVPAAGVRSTRGAGCDLGDERRRHRLHAPSLPRPDRARGRPAGAAGRPPGALRRGHQALLLRLESDKWQVLAGVFFLFLAAMATSVHPTIVLYLGVFGAASLVLLTRFPYCASSPASATRRGGARRCRRRVPLKRLPRHGASSPCWRRCRCSPCCRRVRTPYIIGRGAGTGTEIQSAASPTSSASTASAASARTGTVLPLRYASGDRRVPPRAECGSRPATFERYAAGLAADAAGGRARRGRGLTFHLARRASSAGSRSCSSRSHSRSLPVGAVSLELPRAPPRRRPRRTVSLPGQPPDRSSTRGSRRPAGAAGADHREPMPPDEPRRQPA